MIGPCGCVHGLSVPLLFAIAKTRSCSYVAHDNIIDTLSEKALSVDFEEQIVLSVHMPSLSIQS